ncbi:hypothetical protein BC332_03207 [Capsicum chinense]|nr:hypothetical protein BC332_03207 [Capsicum chinense]
MKLFGAITITRKIIILERGLIVADRVSGDGVVGGRSGATVGVAPLIVFETINHYDHDHTGFIDFPLLANVLDEFHWVLAVVVLKEKRNRVYDSMSGRRYYGPLPEIQKLDKILTTYLDIIGYYD